MTDDKNITENDKRVAQQQRSAIAPAERPELRSDQSWYSSLFTQLLAPLVGTRYIWLALEEINPLNFWGKDLPEIAKDDHGNPIIKDGKYIAKNLGKPMTIDGSPWKEERYLSRNSPAFGMGLAVVGLMGKYSYNTLKDIKAVYAEAVGYELDKKTKDVTLADIFFRSENKALEVTRNAYLKRTAVRGSAAASFFVPWHHFRSKAYRSVQPKYDVNADAGVGAIGALIYGEGFLRKPSFFDIEQKLVSTKINHKDIDPYTEFQPQDIQTLLTLHWKHLNKDYKAPPVSSPEGQNDVKLATRIAGLLNATYDNKPDVTSDKLTIGKLNYLIGFGLLDKAPEALAFVELANKSSDMKEVKQAASAIKAGEDVTQVFTRFGVDIQKLAVQPEQSTTTGISEQKKYTKDIAPKELMEHAAKPIESSMGRAV